MIEILTLIFAGVAATAATTPLFRRIWRHWLRYRWYRTVVALREDRSHTVVDLPYGIKMVLVWVLHPVRRWHGRPTPTEHHIRHFVRCPFYRPKHCVYATHSYGSAFGCDRNGSCYRLESFSTDEEPLNDAAERQRRLVRSRRSKQRPRRYGESPVPCSKCDLPSPTSRRVWMFDMGDGCWLCWDCFRAPAEQQTEARPASVPG